MSVTTVEAVVLDATHLELKVPLSNIAGQRLLVHIIPLERESSHLLYELEVAYLTMSEQERRTEIALAEEGLHGELTPTEAFPGEEEWPWWEGRSERWPRSACCAGCLLSRQSEWRALKEH